MVGEQGSHLSFCLFVVECVFGGTNSQVVAGDF